MSLARRSNSGPSARTADARRQDAGLDRGAHRARGPTRLRREGRNRLRQSRRKARRSCPPPLSAQLLLGMLKTGLRERMGEGRAEIDDETDDDGCYAQHVSNPPKCFHIPSARWPVSQSLSLCATLSSHLLTAFRNSMSHFGISDFP